LDLMDAHDMSTAGATGGTPADDASGALPELKRAAEVLETLRRDVDTDAYADAMKPLVVDPFNLRLNRTKIFVDGARMPLKMTGTPALKSPRATREENSAATFPTAPFGGRLD
jgi:hypothetical protein